MIGLVLMAIAAIALYIFMRGFVQAIQYPIVELRRSGSIVEIWRENQLWKQFDRSRDRVRVDTMIGTDALVTVEIAGELTNMRIPDSVGLEWLQADA